MHCWFIFKSYDMNGIHQEIHFTLLNQKMRTYLLMVSLDLQKWMKYKIMRCTTIKYIRMKSMNVSLSIALQTDTLCPGLQLHPLLTTARFTVTTSGSIWHQWTEKHLAEWQNIQIDNTKKIKWKIILLKLLKNKTDKKRDGTQRHIL